MDRFRGGRGKWIAHSSFQQEKKRQRVTISEAPENPHHCVAQCLERFYQQDDVLQCKTSNDALIGHCWCPRYAAKTITRTSFVSHSAVLRFPDRVCALETVEILNDVWMSWIRTARYPIRAILLTLHEDKRDVKELGFYNLKNPGSKGCKTRGTQIQKSQN
ncbi:hypothetical protein ALC56_09264 [Trachymyrmex septentrionalis]|uniref:Uncharacterized protein n=1 Tax=Trachymyrmex septentrionalis TaxID=34720 RepID=A0A195F8B8_9HYME|nr:hypothetical protein ALC56_09264 [Trachymyrmex septentrionalis]